MEQGLRIDFILATENRECPNQISRALWRCNRSKPMSVDLSSQALYVRPSVM